MLLPAALLAVTLALLAVFARGDGHEYRLFRAFPRAPRRRSRYLPWIVRQALFFALPALAGLALLGRLDTLTTMPDAFAPVAARMPLVVGRSGAVDAVLLGAMAGGLVGGSLIAFVLARWRGGRLPQFGNIDALLPRNRTELALCALLALSAGVTEELMFRLFLPLLVALLTGSGWAAFAVATALFALLHRYQGPVGIVATAAIGMLMDVLYLSSGRLWLAMLVHVAIDLNALVLRPLLARGLRAAGD